mmetsp:Transcript_16099/g.19297  ORF Transcript_16099/g.19297 Transcript_16099/m.19297 type:complete len:201 (-) Transcript_16099:100-702(-)
MMSSGSIAFRFLRILSMSAPNLSTSTLELVAPIFTSAPAISRESPMRSAWLSSSNALHIFGGIVPTIPKSMKATLPSLRTKRFPACTSAWKKSLEITDRVHAFSADTSVASGSFVYFLMLSKSTRGTPSRYSIVKTLEADAEGKTFGQVTARVSSFLSKNAANLRRLSASLLKSSSPIIASLTSSMIPAIGTPFRPGLRY